MYYNLWPRLLEELRTSFIQSSDISEDDFERPGENAKLKEQYYLKDYKRNLICEPNMRHALELEIHKTQEEFKYIAFKKAMIFNLFGNEETFIKENDEGILPGRYRISYMKRIPVIKGKNLNITYDAVLNNYANESLIFCRLKALEWIVLKNETIKEQYLNIESYAEPEVGSVFVEVLKNILSDCMYDCAEFSGVFANLDSLHIIKEIIAAYNLLCTEDEYKRTKRVTIMEIYWKPICYENIGTQAGKVYVKEVKQLREAVELQERLSPVIHLFKDKLDVELDIKCINMWELLKMQNKLADDIKWMYRYIV